VAKGISVFSNLHSIPPPPFIGVGCTKTQYIYAIWKWTTCLSRKWTCQVGDVYHDPPFAHQVQVLLKITTTIYWMYCLSAVWLTKMRYPPVGLSNEIFLKKLYHGIDVQTLTTEFAGTPFPVTIRWILDSMVYHLSKINICKRYYRGRRRSVTIRRNSFSCKNIAQSLYKTLTRAFCILVRRWEVVGSQSGIQYGPFPVPLHGLPARFWKEHTS